MRERARIARFFAPLAASEPGSFNLMDDAAVLTPPTGTSLVVTTDSVIQGIHVLAHATPQHYAQKLVRRNVSDLAAMGATPWHYTLNIHTPKHVDDDWFADFTTALAAEQSMFGMLLIGGDSTSGGDVIHATMTCFGLTSEPVLRRNGAKIGDDLYVSGTIGDAALGLKLLQQSLQQNSVNADALIARYHAPDPRVTVGAALRDIATACIDVSDGLLTDAAQLCAASSVGACINRDAIPRSPSAQQLLQQYFSLWDVILNGGDDYELCFTAPSAARARIQAIAESLVLPITRIGEITASPGLAVVDAYGTPITTESGGWEH